MIKSIISVSYLKPVLFLLCINLVVIFCILIFRNNLPPEIPLFYGRAYGEKQLVGRLGLTIPSLISTGIILLNFIISNFVKEKLLRQILITTSLVTTILSFITTARIALLVGSF